MKTTQPPSTVWECSGEPPQWKAHPPIDNYGDTCLICGRSRPGSKLAQARRSAGSPAGRMIAALVLVSALLGMVVWLFRQSSFATGDQPNPQRLGVLPQSAAPNNAGAGSHRGFAVMGESVPANSSLRYSQGERRLLQYQGNRDGDRGTEAFAMGDYVKAREHFIRAVRGDRRDPEVQIYLNNSEARLGRKTPLTIAVVVPIDSTATNAEEILRGVADAQTEFNKSGGIAGRLLEIVIANDGNNAKIAPGVAQTLIASSDILGVVGHNSSAASEAAVGEYDKANLAMISPTSSSSLISGNVFFRTVLSTEVMGTNLAEYAKRNLKADQVAVFYNSNDAFSRSIQTSFAKHFQEIGGRFVQAIDISSPDFDPEKSVKALQGQFDAIALFPNVELLTVGVSVAVANADLPVKQRMKLLGANTVYRPQTLTGGGSAVEGMTLVVPWFARTPYANRAAQHWGGQVSWRTAMSYDATRAFIQAFTPDATRASILKRLRSVKLAAEDTAGAPLEFSRSGDRLGKPLFVRVVRGKGGPEGSGLSFQPLQE